MLRSPVTYTPYRDTGSPPDMPYPPAAAAVYIEDTLARIGEQISQAEEQINETTHTWRSGIEALMMRDTEQPQGHWYNIARAIQVLSARIQDPRLQNIFETFHTHCRGLAGLQRPSPPPQSLDHLRRDASTASDPSYLSSSVSSPLCRTRYAQLAETLASQTPFTQQLSCEYLTALFTPYNAVHLDIQYIERTKHPLPLSASLPLMPKDLRLTYVFVVVGELPQGAFPAVFIVRPLDDYISYYQPGNICWTEFQQATLQSTFVGKSHTALDLVTQIAYVGQMDLKRQAVWDLAKLHQESSDDSWFYITHHAVNEALDCRVAAYHPHEQYKGRAWFIHVLEDKCLKDDSPPSSWGSRRSPRSPLTPIAAENSPKSTPIDHAMTRRVHFADQDDVAPSPRAPQRERTLSPPAASQMHVLPLRTTEVVIEERTDDGPHSPRRAVAPPKRPVPQETQSGGVRHAPAAPIAAGRAKTPPPYLACLRTKGQNGTPPSSNALMGKHGFARSYTTTANGVGGHLA